jgi:predicted nucleic acid-binding protein
MSTLLDTNLLTRSVQPNHPLHQPAVDAVDLLIRQGETVCLVPQNFYEFWVVATRPLPNNGLGLNLAEVQAEFARLKRAFTIMPDTPAVFPEWETLVTQHQVTGKSAHDARLIAAMKVHGIARLLTFNTQDFQCYAGIIVLSPADLLAATPPSGP